MNVPFLLGAALAMGLASSPRPQPHAGALLKDIRRLGTVGSVLYVAAHPDDENTRLLAWLVGEKGLRAGYLSLTRGDGGQNLIGTEQDELLGLIRTHELLAARRIDGAEQTFTRARDFGYSKSAEETLRIWGEEQVLADVVLAIRRFRPDVVVTRFSTRPPNHGHHTASALLAEKAFAAAADPTRFPEQLGGDVQAWRATRLVHNVSTWNLPKDADMSAYMKLDVGGYDPLLGSSWGEIAAESRSQHKSQGFGVPKDRGPSIEHFQHLAGAPARASILDGVDSSWRRVKGGAAVASAVAALEKRFDPRAPHASIPAAVRVRAAIAKLPDDEPWRRPKLAEVEDLLVALAGLHLEARAPEEAVVPGDEIELRVLGLNRSDADVKLVDVALPSGERVEIARALARHQPYELVRRERVAKDAPITTPYWLKDARRGGLYSVEDPALVGRPEGDPPLRVVATVEVGGARFAVPLPVRRVWTDPVRGELSRLVEIVPPVTATFDRDVVMVPNGAPQDVVVVLAAGRDGVEGALRLQAPPGWRVEPASVPFRLASRGDEKKVRLRVTPPKGAVERARLRAVTDVDGASASWRVRTISYDHVPPLAVRDASEAELVPLSLVVRGARIGYVPGPGDRVAESLAAVGYDVTLLPEERLATEKLDRFDAILIGVRAFNANPRLALHKDALMGYVERGGRLVVQYNTNSRVGPLTIDVGPWPLEIGRDRVTDETAAMTPLSADDPLLAAPNALGEADWRGWVQERGLYFAKSWDPRYRPVFSTSDPGEEPLQGALLVGQHGKGTFVYTGLSFFRQLPAGVPGAYRLLANLLAR